MITVKTGKPGAGKTLLTLQLYVLPAFLAGRHVYCNIPGLDIVKIAYYLRTKHNRKDITSFYIESLFHDYSLEYLSENYKKLFPQREFAPTEEECGGYYLRCIPKAETGSLIVLDEAQKKCYINSKDWDTEKNRKFFEYCSVHRKLKHEVLIITQDDSNIDSSVNGLREELIFLLRQERLGFKNRVSLNYYIGHQSTRNKPYATTSVNYDRAIFDLYESYSAKSDSKFKEVRKTKFLFNNPKLIGVVLLIVVLAAYSFPSFIRMMQGKGLNKRQQEAYERSASFSLGEYEEYYCGEKFFVLRPGGKVDTLEPKNIPSSYCPKFDFYFRREK